MKLITAIKGFCVKILTHDIITGIIRWAWNEKIPFNNLKIEVSNPHISNTEVANIFWHIYEKAEIRLVRKHFKKGIPIIELGSSIGVITSLVGKMKDDSDKLYCFEANQHLIKSIETNLKLNKVINYEIIDKAIGPKHANEVHFTYAPSNLNSRISEEKSDDIVKTVDLVKFLKSNEINHFMLICDIEGAEIYIILEQFNFLKNCQLAIIELHNTHYKGKYYSRQMLNELILTKTNLKFVENYRHVFVYTA